MCAPETHYTVKEKVVHSLKQTWYGGTLIYIAVVLTLIFFARIFDWRVGG